MAIEGLHRPAFVHVPPWDVTLGDEVSQLCELVGFPPDEDQKFILRNNFAYRQVQRPSGPDKIVAAMTSVGIAPRQNWKALYVETVILTTRGWLTMGEVQVGDQVFGADGQPVVVTGASPIRSGHDCYRVTSTDGRSVIADAGHLWSVFDSRLRRWEVLTTSELLVAGLDRGRPRTVTTDGVQYQTREYRWQLPQQHAVQSPDVELPVDPYLLGGWLGNGAKNRAQLSICGTDVEHWEAAIERAGYIPHAAPVQRGASQVGVVAQPGRGYHSRSFLHALRQLGVLSAKAIPADYLTAGPSQREALLQGLLDTDGTIHHRSGQTTFTSMQENLALDVMFLVRSLGWRAGLHKHPAMLKGVDYGTAYDVTFTPKTDDPYRPFRLPRKAERVRDVRRAGRFTISIRSIEPVESVPVRCIKIANDDGVFLAGRDLLPTHNTATAEMTSIGWLVLLKDWVRRNERPPLYIWSAHEYPTALDTHKHLAEIFDGSDFLRRRVKSISHTNGHEAIEMLDGARLAFRARTKTGGRGLAGARTVLDEAFALRDSHMGTLIPTMSARRDAQILYLSSAGHAESYILRDIRDRGRIGDDAIFYIEHMDDLPGECQVPQCDHNRNRPGCVLDDERRWERANSALDRRVSREYIRTVERATMPPGEFARERLGWWDEDPTGGGVFDMDKWRNIADPDSAMTDLVCLAADATPERSSASISIAFERPDGTPYVEVVDMRSGVDWIVERLAELDEKYRPVGTVIDPAGAAGATITDLEAAGVVVIRPTSRQVAQGCGLFYDGIDAQWLRHSGQPELTRALEGAVKRPYSDAWLLDRRHVNIDVTPLISSVLAHWGLNGQMDGGGLSPDEVFVGKTG